jgi:hypothetical protein
MPERIDARPVIAIVGGGLLLISLFLTWFKVPATPPAVGETSVGNAWQVFESLDLVLAAVGISALYAAYEQLTGTHRLGEGGWLLPVSILGLVIVASQILDAPPTATSVADPANGAWIALGGAGALVVAGVLSTARVSLAVELDSSSTGSATRRRRAA